MALCPLAGRGGGGDDSTVKYPGVCVGGLKM